MDIRVTAAVAAAVVVAHTRPRINVTLCLSL